MVQDIAIFTMADQ